MVNIIATANPLAPVEHSAPASTGDSIDYGVLPELTGFSVKLTWVLAHGLVAREFEAGVTPLRFSVLEVIGRNPGLQQMQLAEALALTRPATTLALDFWENRGFIERRKLPADRRSFGVYPTETGMTELRRMRASIKRADLALTSHLTDAETKEFRRLLRKVQQIDS